MALSTLTARVDEEDKAMFISFCDSVQNYSTGETNLVSISIRNAQLPSYLLFLKTVPLWEASFGAH